MDMQQIITQFSLCLLGLLGLTLFASPVTAQVFDSGPSDSALFDNVINLPSDPNIGDERSVGGDGLTTQLNISRGGLVGSHFDANSGSEVNISVGAIGDFFDARTGSEVNISGGTVGDGFRAFADSVVNIRGGRVGDNFHAFRDSNINLFGSNFVLDGVSLNDSLTNNVAFTIDDRDVILSGRLEDGLEFSFELNSVFDPDIDQDFFRSDATLTVTLVSTVSTTITHVPLFTLDGDSANDSFGGSVSGAGDVNGDGVDDLIVGASSDDNNGLSSGSARVFSGVDGSVLYNFEGDSEGDIFGVEVSGAGDVNGDGFADLIVGALGDDDNATNSGSARVFSGVDGSVLYNFEGGAEGQPFGSSVSGAGDVNGDGFADLIVGSFTFLNGNPAINRSVRVLSGSNGSVLYNFEGSSNGDRLGRSVSGAGDVNGDGFDDLIVEGKSQGSARVFSGSDGSVLYDFNFVLSFGIGSIDLSVSGAGDVNGDGFDDLIVGVTERNEFQDLVVGRARVLSGSDGSILFNFDGDSRDDWFGRSVSGAGDVNGDGFDDLIVGATHDDDNGDNSGSARVFSGSDGSALYTFDGDSDLDNFGRSVSGAGDVNGDGLADFIVGASGGGANDGGYARVFVSQISVPILGDCNLDGEANFLDINPFIELLSSATYLEQADCNQDGVLNFLDIAPFIAILSGN